MRDADASAGRIATILAALATGVAGVVTMLSAYAVLTREVPRNYLASVPASAQLFLQDTISPAMLERMQRTPGVAGAARSGRMSGRLRVRGDVWIPLLLFVTPHWERETINRVTLQRGAWPSHDGMLVERSALELTGHALGDSVTIDLGVAGMHTLPMSGTVHDPGVAPAWQEQVVYAYVDEAVLRGRGVLPQLDILKIVATDWRAVPAISAIADSGIATIAALGGRVHEVHIPPPGRHPHQAQMNAVMTMLLAFSVLALLLGAVLTASVIDGLLARQVRQVAIMKAIGASASQVTWLYVTLVATIGIVAVLVGIPAGIAAGRGMIGVTAQLLNLDITSTALPWWLYATAIALGTLVPVLAALVPIRAAARITVRDGLDHAGVTGSLRSSSAALRSMVKLRLGSAAFDLAARNLLRRRGRVSFDVALLAMAGAMCIASLNLRAAWQRTVRDSAAERHYALEVRLERPTAPELVTDALRRVPAVTRVEAWASSGASLATGRNVEISRTYPDGGHGGFGLRGAPPTTTMIEHQMVAGRWLVPGDSDAVVINTLAATLAFDGKRPGDRLVLRVADADVTFTLVGIVREHLTPGTAYVTPARFGAVTGSGPLTNTVRIALQSGTDADSASRDVAGALQRHGIAVRSVQDEARVGAAQGGHVMILVVALGLIAAIMSIVGLLGLSSSLGVSVVERTREFGVMRAVGARTRSILLMVVAEGLLIAVASWLAAVPLAVLLSRTVGGVLARISTQQLDLRLTPFVAAAWLGAVLPAAILVSLWPARRAARLTVRQALSFT